VFASLRKPEVMVVTLSAAGILMITIGIRQSLGLFVGPIHASLGLGIASISLAMAVLQLTWGAVQPFAGAMADRFGPAPVLTAGILILSLGTILAPMTDSTVGLVVTLGILTAIGSGTASFSVLIGAASQRIPAELRGSASGVINAGGSLGQFLLSPIVQKAIQFSGWINAMWGMALVALLALPLIRKLGDKPAEAALPPQSEGGALHAVRTSLRSGSFWLLNAGFFTCGFHIAFLSTHLPGEINLCGLPQTVAGWSLSIIGFANIFGSFYAGHWVSKYPSRFVLAALYALRALLIGCYMAMPRTEMTFYLFAAGLGFTWLATVPPTVAIIGKLFGVRYLATLFGLTLFTHQVGGFFGAWLGGIAFARGGDYSWMWYADIGLASFAAVVNLPIREVPVQPAGPSSLATATK
jgi:MFS family permease